MKIIKWSRLVSSRWPCCLCLCLCSRHCPLLILTPTIGLSYSILCYTHNIPYWGACRFISVKVGNLDQTHTAYRLQTVMIYSGCVLVQIFLRKDGWKIEGTTKVLADLRRNLNEWVLAGVTAPLYEEKKVLADKSGCRSDLDGKLFWD